MPLLTTNHTVTPTSLYPDRIRVNYRYRLSGDISDTTICNALQERGFTRISNQQHFRGTYTSERYGLQISAFISVSRGNEFLNIYVDINPLRHLHDQHEDYGNEHSFDGSSNWLHPESVRPDNRYIWHEANELIWLYESVAYEFAGELAINLGPSPIAYFQGVTIDRMELTCDFASAQPIQAVQNLRAAFQGAFANVRVNNLPVPTSSSERVEGDIPILHGNWRAGLCFRLYPKTNQRFRLECEIQKRGFQSLRIPRTLSRHDSDFAQFFLILAEQVTPQFNAILERGAEPPAPGGSHIDFIMGVSSTVRDPNFVRRVIDMLISNGRVTSRQEGTRIRRLAERGYLERSGRGIYVVSAQWRQAIVDLENSQPTVALGFLMGRV